MSTVDLKSLIKARIGAVDQTIDLSDSSQLIELTVNPLTGSMQSVQDLIDRFDIAFDARRASEMSDDEADQMASRWSITRKAKQFSSGSVVIRYATPQDVVIEIGQQFNSFNGSSFIAVQRTALNSVQMASLFDPIAGNYPVTILNVQSLDAGPDSNANAGDITSMIGQSFNIVSISNPAPFSKSKAGETNVELIDRAVRSASIRNYASNDSAVATVSEDIRVKSASAIGAGDPEMIRDIVYGIHQNGMQDIYVYTADALVESTAYLNTSDLVNSSSYLVSGSLAGQPPGPYVFIKSIEYGTGTDAAFTAAGKMTQGNEYLLDFYQSSEGTKNSAIESWVVNFVKLPASPSVKITFLRAPLISTLQGELPSLGARSTAHNTLYKAITPVFLDMSATVHPAQGKSTDPAFYVGVINSFINATPIAATMTESGLITALTEAGAERVYIPILASARVLYPNLTFGTTIFAQEISASGLSRGSATERTMAFYSGNITVTVS